MSEPTPRDKELPFADESKDTDLQHSIRNLWHDNFNESEFMAECEQLINAEVLAVLTRLGKNTVRTTLPQSNGKELEFVPLVFINEEKQRYGGKEQS